MQIKENIINYLINLRNETVVPTLPALWIYLNSQQSLINVKLFFFPLQPYFKSPGNYMLLEDRNCFGLCTYVQFFCAEFIKK